MRQADLDRYRTVLLEMRQRTRAEIERMMEVVSEDTQAHGEHDLKKSESVDKEVVLENTEESIRNAVNAALQRIEVGGFGICQDCATQITKRRLDALPHTAYCINCERKRESGQTRP